MLRRRELLKRAGIGALAAGFPGLMLAKADTDARLVLFILHGAMDGMAMLAPYGDGNYAGLRGGNPVTSWAPSRVPHANEETMRRVEALYANDKFFSTRLEQALHAREIVSGMSGAQQKRGRQAKQLKVLMQATARFLSAANGPRIAVLESGGWDTHARQGAASGSLANKFAVLDQGISALEQELGSVWSKTVVLVVTEFGRTARVNGTRGTDHGTATAALLVGGAVNGGRVVADWPGLSASNLYQGRGLYPTTDIRGVFKGVLAQHLHLQEAFLDRSVFPGSKPAPVIENLVNI